MDEGPSNLHYHVHFVILHILKSHFTSIFRKIEWTFLSLPFLLTITVIIYKTNVWKLWKFERRRQIGQGPWDLETIGWWVSWFSFCFMYLRLGDEEARNPEISTGTNKISSSTQTLLCLVKEPGKGWHNRNNTFKQNMIYSNQMPQKKTVVSLPPRPWKAK